MAVRQTKRPARTGLYHARRSRGLSHKDLAAKVHATKNTIIRLESTEPPPKGIRLTREWAERLGKALNYTAEQIMFWRSEYEEQGHIESSDILREPETKSSSAPSRTSAIRELDVRAGLGGGGVPSREVVKNGIYADPVKVETWDFPNSYLHEIGVLPKYLLMLESTGDSMVPTIMSGERLLADTRHKQPSPDGIYALRDAFDSIIVKRLQLLRTMPPRVQIISDNPNHKMQEVGLDEIEIVGKVVIALKRF